MARRAVVLQLRPRGGLLHARGRELSPRSGAMKKILVLVALAACQPDTKNLERKVDELNKKIDNLIAQGGRPGAAQPQRPSRPEPDRAKTYSMPVDGDAFEGPADAKVTI